MKREHIFALNDNFASNTYCSCMCTSLCGFRQTVGVRPPNEVVWHSPPRNKKPGTAEQSTAVLYYRRKKYREICDIPGTAKVGTVKKQENREPSKKVRRYCNTAPSETAKQNGTEVNPVLTGHRPGQYISSERHQKTWGRALTMGPPYLAAPTLSVLRSYAP